MNSIPNSQLNVDLKALDKLVSTLLEQRTTGSKAAGAFGPETGTRTPPLQRLASKKLNRWRPLSRSAHSGKHKGDGSELIGGSFTQLLERVDPSASSTNHVHPPNMPTIMESSAGSPPTPSTGQEPPPPWTAALEAPHGTDDLNLTHNYVG